MRATILSYAGTSPVVFLCRANHTTLLRGALYRQLSTHLQNKCDKERESEVDILAPFLKLKIMNPTFKYNPATHSLDEVARMSEPNPPLYRYWEDYVEDRDKYNAHIASLRHIPCEKDTQWSEGELVEGRDFELLRGKQIDKTDEQQWQQMSMQEKDAYYQKVAIPIKPEADADLWDEVIKIAFKYKEAASTICLKQHLQKHFTITKKQ